MIDVALGRVERVRAALDHSDLNRVVRELHQLKGACLTSNQTALAERVHSLEALVAAGPTPTLRSRVTDELSAIAQAIDRIDGHRPDGRMTVTSQMVEMIWGEAVRASSRRDVDLTRIEKPITVTELPVRTSALLVDLCGHLVRNAVVHGSGGGAVAIALGVDHTDGTLCVSVVSRGRTRHGVGDVTADHGRGVALAAIQYELRQQGGLLRHGPTSDGYVAEIRLPDEWMRPAVADREAAGALSRATLDTSTGEK